MKESEKFVITHGAALDNAVHVMREMLNENGWIKVQCNAGNRTLSQNALYWVWIAQITDELNKRNGTDFTTEEIHTRMKHDHLGYDDPRSIGSTQIPAQLKTTTKLSKGEMFAYMERLDMFWAERGIYLVTPDDSVYAQLKEQRDAGRTE